MCFEKVGVEGRKGQGRGREKRKRGGRDKGV